MALDRTLAFAPGRLNLIGEFTDYNQSLALPFAIDAGVRVRATASAERWMRAGDGYLQSRRARRPRSRGSTSSVTRLDE
jgi:galactokinase